MEIKTEITTLVIETRDGASVTFDPAKVTDPAIFANLLAYGIGQKIRDSRSQATSQAEKDGKDDSRPYSQALMETALEALYKGEWTQRGEGTGASTETLIARSIVKASVKADWGAKSADWIKFTKLEPDVQLAKLDGWVATIQADSTACADLDAKVAAEIERRKAKAADTKGLAGKVKLAL